MIRRKRLQHAAHTLCHMFCGWRLFSCYGDLARLGSGQLKIDALSGDCLFDGTVIDTLSIALELQAWLQQDCETHRIRVDDLDRASLIAELRFSIVDADQRVTTDRHFKQGEPITTGRFHRLNIRCTSEIATGEAVYQSGYDDVEEWPVGWQSA